MHRQQICGKLSGFLSAMAILVPALLITAFSAGCLSQAVPGANPPAGAETGTGITGIGSILENPSEYENRTVTVSGRITLECGSGCWFNLDDGSGTIYVDLKAHNFAIPQVGGKQAVVTGTVAIRDNTPTILGEQVEVGGKIYP